jgi:hypothetical protein
MQVTNDVERGSWLLERLQGLTSVGSVAGQGAEAYVRLLHPLWRDARHEWTEQRWSEVAAARGRVMHPLVQWGRLHDVQDPYAPGSSIGWLDPVVLAALVPLLGEATTTPDDLVAGFWAGGSGQRLVSAEQLQVPGRECVLATTSVDELSDPDWGYGMRLGWLPYSRHSSLQLLWPEDHAWVLASEIDWDSTIVAGSRSLVDGILGDGRFEAFEVGPDDDLSWDGDVVNGPPAP